MKDLIDQYDPRLRKPCAEFDFKTGVALDTGETLNAEQLFERLKESMCENRGVGLSACQIGIMTRVFVIGNPDDPDMVIPVFNPRIVSVSEDTEDYEEGCLSFPGLYLKITRPKTVKVRYANQFGHINTITFDGFTARVFQHECDHMDGVVFKSRVSRLVLERAEKQRKQLNRLRKQRLKKNFSRAS